MTESDIETAFETADGPALIPYITAGDPDPDATGEYVRALVRGGADVIELGLPFSEPIADGSTIQEAIQRSLSAGMNPELYFDIIGDLDVDVPLVCMTYYNLLLQYGADSATNRSEADDEGRSALEPFVEAAAAAGISGLIIPDLPVEESDDLRAACDAHGVDLIFVLAPTTRGERVERIMEQVSGFVYVQARLGTTGARRDVSEQTHRSLQRIADYNVPQAVGFGVSEADHATEIVAAGADGVVAGSVFVDIIADGGETVSQRLESKARELKDGARAGVSQRDTRPERT